MTGNGRSGAPAMLPAEVEQAVSGRASQLASAALRLSDAAQSLAFAAKELLSMVEPHGDGEHDVDVITAVARWRSLSPRPLRAFNRHEDMTNAASSWEAAVHRWEIALQLFRWEAEFSATRGER